MARKRSKKKTDFNQYLPLLLIGTLVVAFVFLGAGPTGKFLEPGTEELPGKSERDASSNSVMSGPAVALGCSNPIIDDQDCDDWLGENDCDDTDASLGPWRTFYADNDGDGHATSIPSQVCTAIVQTGTPSGYMLTAGGDCNDNNFAMHNCPVGTIFTSSQKYDGNLGGLTGADSKCTSLAQSSGMFGSWTALLSDSTVDMSDRLPDTQYMNTRGQLVAIGKDKGQYAVGHLFYYDTTNPWVSTQPVLMNPIYDENGMEIPFNAAYNATRLGANPIIAPRFWTEKPVWTGVQKLGSSPNNTNSTTLRMTDNLCTDWTSNQIGRVDISRYNPQYNNFSYFKYTGGIIGDAALTNVNWQSLQWNVLCSWEFHLYCVRTS